jgi:RAB protein geranylgeranyltransferase component A
MCVRTKTTREKGKREEGLLMEQPTEFDVIVCGTSLVNCILAAALSKAGVSVLHLDGNEFYGEEEGTHDLGGFVAELERSVALGAHGFVQSVAVTGREAIEACKSDWRRYALDGTSKTLLCSGPLVQLLVRSEVSKYLEFKCLNAAFLRPEGAEAVRVPCSKADVFQSTSISLVEKRYLMKFLSVFQEEAVPAEWAEKTFAAVLDEHRMEGALRSVIVHAICGVESLEGLSAANGARLVRQYVASVGRFGNTPFLFPLYGCSETAQAFSRLAAVNGATYMLRKSVRRVTELPEGPAGGLRFVVVDGDGEEWKCKHVVVSPGSCGTFEEPLAVERSGRVAHHAYALVRGVVVPEAPLAQVTHVVEGRVVQALHLDGSMKVCPDGCQLVRLWSTADVLPRVLAQLGNTEWTVSWTTQARRPLLPSPFVMCTSDPDIAVLDYEATIAEAQAVFEKLAPEGAVFFPAAPATL